MSITLRGEHISLVKPLPARTALVYKSERPYARKRSKSKTNHAHCGKVVEVIVETEEYQYSLAKGTHLDVLEAFDLATDDVVRTGWKLDNGNYVWR